MPALEASPSSAPREAPRPLGLWLLTVGLLASPLIHLLALQLGRHWLNYGSPRAWDGFVYFLIAPIVGTLMLRRHERARFSVYVFLSCEILRAVRIHSPALGVLAVAAILYLQLPAARRFHPRVDPQRVLERIRLRRRPMHERLRELQQREADRFRQQFESSLTMPIDAGAKILERSRALKEQLEDPAVANPADSSSVSK